MAGPGPIESHQKPPAAPKHADSLETGNLLGDYTDTTSPQAEEEGDEDYETVNPNIKPEEISSDPYANLDLIFGSTAPLPSPTPTQPPFQTLIANSTDPVPAPQEPEVESRKKKLRNSYRQSVQVFSELPVPGL